MYTDTATQTPKSRQMWSLQYRHCNSALVIHNSQYICSNIVTLLHKSEHKTRFNYKCTAWIAA